MMMCVMMLSASAAGMDPSMAQGGAPGDFGAAGGGEGGGGGGDNGWGRRGQRQSQSQSNGYDQWHGQNGGRW